MRLNDPAVVRAEYATERGLEARRAAYRFSDGPDAREMAFAAVAEVRPQRVLEVGCGPGELSARIAEELGRFAKVEERDASGTVRFPGRDAVVAYVEASISLFGTDKVPEFDGPLIVRRRPVIFVAEK